MLSSHKQIHIKNSETFVSIWGEGCYDDKETVGTTGGNSKVVNNIFIILYLMV